MAHNGCASSPAGSPGRYGECLSETEALSIEVLVTFVARAIFGVAGGMILALVAQLISWTVWVSLIGWSQGSFVVTLVIVSGIGAGIGGTAGWMRLDDGRRVMLKIIALAISGGFAGAWVGVVIGRSINEDVRYSQEIAAVTILAAGIGANILPLVASAYWARVWRGGSSYL